MKTYKTLKHLETRLIKNNNKKVTCWNDEGIKVNNKKYFMQEYGDIHNHCYVTFRNIGRKGRHKGLNEPLNSKDEFITIEYELNSNKERKGCLFKFILIREWW